jgi:hypothetical protein
MTTTAVLAVAGGACFALKSAHLGTVLVAAIGVVWMWQDMMDEAATAAQEKGATLPPDAAPLLALHQ